MYRYIPQLNIDLPLVLLYPVREDGVVVFLQSSLHAVEALKLDEAGAHELVVLFVRAHTNLEGFELGEMCFNRFFGGGEGEVA